VENILIPYKDAFELFRDTVEHLNKYFKDTASYISEVINREWDYPHVDGMANNELNESNRSIIPDPGQNQVKVHDLNTSSKSGKINRQATIPVAFTYVSFVRNSSAIADLFDSLIKNRFIGSDVNKRDFIRIFDNSQPNQQIKWIGTFSELVYFVKLLHSTHKFINPMGNNIWKVTSTLFVDKDGKTYDYLRFKGQKKPSKTNVLEKTVMLLK
jgi:hypothetical protein